MKSSPFAITIPKPCSNHWSDMSDTDKGKFCVQCEKNVIDLSKLSDQDVVIFLKNHKGPVCGRLHQHQLDRIIEVSDHKLLRRRFPNFFATAMIALAAYQEISAATLPTNLNSLELLDIQIEENSFIEFDAASNPDSLQTLIHGVVVDSLTGDPLIYARIHVAGTDISHLTDENGQFSFTIPVDKESVQLLVSFSDHTSKKVPIDRSYLQSADKEKLIISLEYPLVYLGKLNLIDSKEYRRFKKLK